MTARKMFNALAGAFAGLTWLACAGTQVSTDRDTHVNLAQYRTFDVKTGQVLANGIVDTRNTLVRDRVEAALLTELQDKGLEPSQQSPDLIATYTAGAREVVVEDDWDFDYYGYSPGWDDEYTETALLIDLIDRRTNKLVWRSVVRMDDDALSSAKEVDHAVVKALEKFPG